ncbi:MAG: nucleoside deaminase [Candidatus Komeilibacteria bacterium]|nr:nucleoside deaminase [Candidatus Komeilibacteria bacterium]
MENKDFLQLAIDKSKTSVTVGAFPVGAIIVQNGKIVASAISNGKQLKDPTSHAEVAVIREVCQKLQNRDLKDVILYSSLEPCLMCYAASFWASIPKIVYACSRQRVSIIHYEGDHHLNEINQASRHPIELVHIKEMEESALKVIEDWESSLKK